MAVHNSISGTTAVQIAASVEAGIRSGALSPDDRLPTVRALAAELGISPATAASAYRTLRQRGLIATQGRRGTRVSPLPPVMAPRPAALAAGVVDLAYGNPDPDLLPALGPALARLDPPPRLYGDDLEDARLVRLAARAFEQDGIAADDLTIVSGALDGIERVLAAHLSPGDAVAVEDPAFSGTLSLLQVLGLVPIPVRIDEFGLLPEALEKGIRAGARAVVLTPRAQNPTGAALDARRAKHLERVLRQFGDCLIIEDDHAGIASGVPAFSLCRGRRHWAVVRSYAKTLGPDLRVAALVGDAETIARVSGRQLIGMRWVSHVLQQLVASLLSDRKVDRLLARAAETYTRRRAALLQALSAHGIPAMGRSGLNVWIPVPEESSIISALLDRRWAVAAGERFRLGSPPAIRVTTARLDVKAASDFARDLAEVLEPTRRTLTP